MSTGEALARSLWDAVMFIVTRAAWVVGWFYPLFFIVFGIGLLRIGHWLTVVGGLISLAYGCWFCLKMCGG